MNPPHPPELPDSQSILDAAGTMIIACQPDGTVTVFNPAAEKLLGWSAEEVIGRHSPLLWNDPTEVERRAAELTRERNEPVPADFSVFKVHAQHTGSEQREWTYLHKNGNRFPVLLTITALRDAAGHVNGLLGTAQELSKRVRAEGERDRFFQLAIDPLCIARQDGRLRDANEAFCRIVGLSPEDLSGHSFLDFLHDDDRTVALQHLDSLATGTPVLNFETRCLCADDTWRIFSWNIQPYNDQELYLAARDVTEFRQLQTSLQMNEQNLEIAELREREERYRTLLNQLPASVFVYDRETLGYLAVSDRAVADYGYSREEFLQMTIADVRPAEDVPSLLDMLAKAGTDFENRGLWRHRKQDGTVFDVQITTHGLELSGRPACIVMAFDVTEQLRAERALRQSELLNRKVIDSALDCIVSMDAQGRIIDFNPAAEATFGWSKAEVLGHRVSETIIPQRYRADHKRGMAHFLETGEGPVIGRRIMAEALRSDGSLFAVELTVIVIDIDGQQTFTAFLRDMTALTRAEQELRRTSELLQAVIEGTSDAIFVKDRQGRYLLFNQAASRFVGLSSAEVLGKDDLTLFGPEDGRRLMNKERTIMETGVPQTDEELLTAAGQQRTYLATKVPLYDKAKQIIGLIGISRDISDRKQTELALQASEARYRSIVEHSQDLIFINHENEIVFINQAGVDMLGAQSAEEILGLSPYDLFHPDDHPVIQERIRELRSRECVVPSIEERIVARDGEWIDVEVQASSFSHEGHFDIQVVCRDIRLRKQAERERQQLLQRERQARQEADAASRHYQALFESAPGCYLVLSAADFTIVAVSEAYLQATLTTREELRDRILFELFTEAGEPYENVATDHLKTSLERVKQLHQADVMPVQCFPIRCPDSLGGGFEERYWSIINSPVPGPDGQVAYIIHRVEDVTEYLRLRHERGEGEQVQQELAIRTQMLEADIVLRSHELKRAYEQLAQSQQLLGIAAQLGQIGGWSVTVPRLEIKWTEEVRAIHQLQPDEIPTLDEAILFYDPEYREMVLNALNRCASEGVPFDLESPFTTAAGNYIWVRVIGQPQRDASGRIILIHGAMQNITGRKDAEARERELTNRFREMAENIQDVFFNFDPVHQKMLYVSPGFEIIWGRSRSEFEHNPRFYREQIHPDDLALEIDSNRLLEEGEPTDIVYRVIRPDGQTVWVRERAYPIRDEAGQVVRIVGVARDITNNRQ